MSGRGYEEFDVLVIGAGFGGLGAALAAAERGAKVKLCETLRYPGGCAGTFQRSGYRFEAGATLSSGFASGQLFDRWRAQHQIPLKLQRLDPVLHFRSAPLSLDIPGDRAAMIASLMALPDAPQKALQRFFHRQEKISHRLWALFSDPALLPPLSGAALLTHLRRLPGYLSLLPLTGRSLGRLLRRDGLESFSPLRLYLNALCQITLQCSADEAEAPLALAVMDYYFRGASHVHGGLGALANGLAEATESVGGTVSYSDRVTALEERKGGWNIQSRRGQFQAKVVIANLLPQGLTALVPSTAPRLRPLKRKVEDSWGAVMLYLVAEEPEPGSAEHWQLIDDAAAPLQSGNHVFCSISSSDELDRAPKGHRTLTLSSHFPIVADEPNELRAERVQAAQERMRSTFAHRCPRWSERVHFEMSASPRTFARFTGRAEGRVGGPPRRRGVGQYLSLAPVEPRPRLFLVGDSVFPGQSTLACALSGHRAIARAFTRYLS